MLDKSIKSLVDSAINEAKSKGFSYAGLDVPDEYQGILYNNRYDLKLYIESLGYTYSDNEIKDIDYNGWDLHQRPDGSLPDKMVGDGKNKTSSKRVENTYRAYRAFATFTKAT